MDSLQALPSLGCLHADASDHLSAAFKALLTDYMKRSPTAAPVVAGAELAQDCCKLDQQSRKAWQAIAEQSKRDVFSEQQDLPDKLDTAIAKASQARLRCIAL